MRHHFSILSASVLTCILTACTTNQTSPTSSSEEILHDSDFQTVVAAPAIDTLKNGPFNKRASYFKNDDNGGYEEYRLTMNLYEKDIPDSKGILYHGILALYVKTPDNTEGIEISHRLINQVDLIEGNTAQLRMISSEERPQTFNATLTYNPEDYTYTLHMAAPTDLEDLMENQITLQ